MITGLLLSGKPIYRILVVCNKKCDGNCLAPEGTAPPTEAFFGYPGSPSNFHDQDEAVQRVTELRSLVSDHDYEVIEIRRLNEEEPAA